MRYGHKISLLLHIMKPLFMMRKPIVRNKKSCGYYSYFVCKCYYRAIGI